MKRYEILAAVAAAALIPSVAAAQTAPATTPAAGVQVSPTTAIAAGATVYDTSGGVVGTVVSTDGTNAVIDTGTNKAAVPLTSLGKGGQGPVLAMTKAQLDAAAGAQQQQASAAFRSQLVTGSSVYGTGGTKLGTIKAVDQSMVTLSTDKGDAKLPIAGFGPGPQGVTIGMTAAQLSSAMGDAPSVAGVSATGTATTDTAASPPGPTEEASTTPPGATTTATKKTKPRK